MMPPRAAVLIAGLGLTACTTTPSVQPPIPEVIAAPGETPVLILHAAGAQIYDCKADAAGKLVWTFREPVATLTREGKTMGRHYAGPTWELADSSAVTGRAATNAPGATANDILWLKLDVVTRRGKGALSAVATIQRINTEGGSASGACEKAGALLSVPYAADYVFLKKGA
jgi:hypothetical protein